MRLLDLHVLEMIRTTVNNTEAWATVAVGLGKGAGS
jgi:hypothetical protein